MYFWIFMTVSRYFLRTFLETAMIFPNIANSAELQHNFAEFATRFTEIFPEIKAKSSEIFCYTENIEPS